MRPIPPPPPPPPTWYQVLKPFPVWVQVGTKIQTTEDNRKLPAGPIFHQEESQVGDTLVDWGASHLLGNGDHARSLILCDPQQMPYLARVANLGLLENGYLAPTNPGTKLEVWKKKAAEIASREVLDPGPKP